MKSMTVILSHGMLKIPDYWPNLSSSTTAVQQFSSVFTYM